MMVSIINNWSAKAQSNATSITMDDNLNDIPMLEESGRGCRSKRKQADPTCCPVCSVTLRDNELEAHLESELDKLSKLSNNVKHKKCSKSQPSNSNSSSPCSAHGKGWDTYQKVRANRQVRQRAKCKKRRTDEVTCPVCNKATSEDITLHVEMCLQQTERGGNNSSSEDENIDVEGFEEYEWAGQTRIRASSLLEGGYANTGMAMSVTKATSDEEDIDVIVDGDDTQIYGSVQYSDQDLKNLNDPIDQKSSTNNENSEPAAKETETDQEKSTMENGWPSELSPYPVLEALKSRIRELESRDQNKEPYKCLICMGPYKTPVVSVCCWHVHCEQCWLKTLATKKLCPQCNMITSTSDLRRIYI